MNILTIFTSILALIFIFFILSGAYLLYTDKQRNWELQTRCENSRYKHGKKPRLN